MKKIVILIEDDISLDDVDLLNSAAGERVVLQVTNAVVAGLEVESGQTSRTVRRGGRRQGVRNDGDVTVTLSARRATIQNAAGAVPPIDNL